MTTEKKPTEPTKSAPIPSPRASGNAGTIWINATWRDKPEYRKLAADDDEANRVFGAAIKRLSKG